MKIELDTLAPANRRDLIMATNLIVIAIIFTLSMAKLLIMGVEHMPITGLLLVAGCLANIIYIRREGSIDIAARILVALMLLGLFFGSYNTGGFGGPIVMLSPLIPVLTMLLINSRTALISLGLVILTLGGLFTMELNGAITANLNGPGRILTGRFVIILSLCLMATWVVWGFARVSRGLLEKIEKQSNTDYLTGILNRRALEATLSREVSRAQRNDTWLSFIITDVDCFKLYNDTNGHQAGDQCLIKVAQVIGSCTERATDLVGRYGGEEFVVILPDTDMEGANKVAERIRNDMLNLKIPYGADNPDPVTLTLGVVSARGQAITSMEQLVREADDALYQGKNQGRNRVVSVTLDDDDLEMPIRTNIPNTDYSQAQ